MPEGLNEAERSLPERPASGMCRSTSKNVVARSFGLKRRREVFSRSWHVQSQSRGYNCSAAAYSEKSARPVIGNRTSSRWWKTQGPEKRSWTRDLRRTRGRDELLNGARTGEWNGGTRLPNFQSFCLSESGRSIKVVGRSVPVWINELGKGSGWTEQSGQREADAKQGAFMDY